LSGDAPAGLDGWRIIAARGEADPAYSRAIMHVADVARSDPRLAGLMLRCGKTGVEPVIVVVEPFSPQARPKITLRAGAEEFYFRGIPVAAGAGLRMPAESVDLATGLWRRASEVWIKISDRDVDVDGVVGLSGFAEALQALADCTGNHPSD
jgi:hypothetical protein